MLLVRNESTSERGSRTAPLPSRRPRSLDASVGREATAAFDRAGHARLRAFGGGPGQTAAAELGAAAILGAGTGLSAIDVVARDAAAPATERAEAEAGAGLGGLTVALGDGDAASVSLFAAPGDRAGRREPAALGAPPVECAAAPAGAALGLLAGGVALGLAATISGDAPAFVATGDALGTVDILKRDAEVGTQTTGAVVLAGARRLAVRLDGGQAAPSAQSTAARFTAARSGRAARLGFGAGGARRRRRRFCRRAPQHANLGRAVARRLDRCRPRRRRGGHGRGRRRWRGLDGGHRRRAPSSEQQPGDDQPRREPPGAGRLAPSHRASMAKTDLDRQL